MLVDDNKDDNFFHERVIRKNNSANMIIAESSGKDAIEYLKEKKVHENAHPDLIFLDINMPGMNGWEFLEEYNKLDKELQSKIVVVMLTTSENPDDKAKAKALNILSDFKTKPLTQEMLDEIINKYF
jgi:CheY-like chemotaxis protein